MKTSGWFCRVSEETLGVRGVSEAVRAGRFWGRVCVESEGGWLGRRVDAVG